MDMSHTMVKLETMTGERKQHAWELKTRRQKYDALMKTVEDLTNENKLLKKELESRKVKETLSRKNKEMEQKEMEKSYTSAVGDAKPVDTAKWEPEIEVRPLVKQGEVQREPNPAKSDSDDTGTTLEEQTGENMERRRKAFYLDDEEVDSVPERRSSDNKHEEKAYERRGPYRNSESGQKASDKEEGPYHEDDSKEKTAKRILR